jgi:AmmeMemoRadiSam system protein B
VLVLFGGHLSPDDADIIVTDDCWKTPLGDVRIDRDISSKLREKLALSEWPTDYVDNAVEVHLPLVKYFFPSTPIVVLGVAPRPYAADLGQAVANELQENSRKALVVGSTDLTHYGPRYGFVPKGLGPASVDWVREINDRQIIDAILCMEEHQTLSEAVSHHNACCPGSVVAAIAACRVLGARTGVLLDYCTSYDVSADENFVGYAGVVF